MPGNFASRACAPRWSARKPAAISHRSCRSFCVRAQVPRRRAHAGRGHAGGVGVRARAVGAQLDGRQLYPARRVGCLRPARRRAGSVVSRARARTSSTPRQDRARRSPARRAAAARRLGPARGRGGARRGRRARDHASREAPAHRRRRHRQEHASARAGGRVALGSRPDRSPCRREAIGVAAADLPSRRFAAPDRVLSGRRRQPQRGRDRRRPAESRSRPSRRPPR